MTNIQIGATDGGTSSELRSPAGQPFPEPSAFGSLRALEGIAEKSNIWNVVRSGVFGKAAAVCPRDRSIGVKDTSANNRPSGRSARFRGLNPTTSTIDSPTCQHNNPAAHFWVVQMCPKIGSGRHFGATRQLRCSLPANLPGSLAVRHLKGAL